jgi:hypothetical protein
MRAGPLAFVLTVLATPALAQPAPAPPPAAQQRQGDTRTDLALRRVLGVLMQQYGELTGKVPDSLSEADIALREAARALEAGNDAAAAAAIRRAIAALQKGGRSMSQQLALQFGRAQGEGEEGEGEGDEMESDQSGDGDGRGSRYSRNGRWNGTPGDRRADAGRDPLGRPLDEQGNGQSPSDGGVRVPDEMEQARARAIQEELRGREADRTRPQPELDYIDRLLKEF